MPLRLSRIPSFLLHLRRNSTSMVLHTRRQIPGDLKIELTEVENQLCTLLDECCTDLKETKSINTSCRIAGGWVRDKLLGMQSNDIDIALTDMMGEDFAGHLSAFAKSKDVKTGAIAIFNPNPEQSKHLQTARIPIFGLELDLVNLRSEEYADNSRIPTAIAFGTPLQDALRRDITINALFYNIHTREVEDCTEKLRILRSLRFATRFGFEIVPELAEAVKDPVIQDALVNKVKRERVGEEISKMMKGADPTRSIQMIDDLSLYDAIFNVVPLEVKGSLSGPIAPSTSSVKAACVLRSILSPSGSALENLTPVHPALVSSAKDDPGATARLYLAAALLPHFGITYRDKKRTYAAVECAVRESLKLGTQNHYLDGIPLLFEAAELFEKNPDLSRSDRKEIGLFLRGKALHHPSSDARWQLSALFSLVRELSPHYELTTDQLDASEAAKLIDRYNAFVARVEELELTNIGAEKPLLNASSPLLHFFLAAGNTVCQVLGASRPGAWTGAWQLQNPKGTADDCTAWLKEEQSAGRIDIDSEPASKRARTQR
ncbi:hypothetical protein B0H14DRAFT_2792039 [Mycena olivaceomarginata]|nr:hypothetical protein B0H14DRAFT_2792039 [Mycena olivaceomarginata]